MLSMGEQVDLFGGVLDVNAGEASTSEAPPNGPSAPAPKPTRRQPTAIQLALSGENLPADAMLWGQDKPQPSGVTWNPWPEDDDADDAGDDPSAADTVADAVDDPFSSFPGRELSPDERKLRDELRALEYDKRSAWAQWVASRPQTRSECAADREAWATDEELKAGKAPCRRFGCAYHLATSVNEHGSLKVWWPSKDGGVAVEAMPETCALDVADNNPEGLFNGEVALRLGMSEEGARLVIEEALSNVGQHAEALVGVRVPSGRVVHRTRRDDEEKVRSSPVGDLCAWHDTGRPPEVPSNAWLEIDCPTCQDKLRRGVLTGREPRIVEYLRQKEAAIRAKRRTRGSVSSPDLESARVSPGDSDHGAQGRSNLSSVQLTDSEEIDRE